MHGDSTRRSRLVRWILYTFLGTSWTATLLVATQFAPIKAAVTPLIELQGRLEWAAIAPFRRTKRSEGTARLVIDLSQREVTFYKGSEPVKTYPVAVGRRGWETPTGEFQIIQMVRNPVWIHPLNNTRIAAGDRRNPLGRYWIGFWTDGTNWIGFHGTPNPETVGREISHGCIRMYNQDIEELFQKVTPGTPVEVVP